MAERSRRDDIMWISPKNIRVSRDSRAVAEVLDELGLTKGTIGVVGQEPCPCATRRTSPRVLQHGDVISAEVFSNFGGRHTQHQVTIALGEVHEDLERAAGVARAAYDAGLRALRPGRTFGEVVAEVREPLEAADGWVFGPAVHGLNPYTARILRAGTDEFPG